MITKKSDFYSNKHTLRSSRKYKKLSAEQERRFISEIFSAKIMADVSGKDKRLRKLLKRFVECNIGMVYLCAQKFIDRGLDFDDLVSEGLYGLHYALFKFELKKKTKFSTYAIPWIMHYMRRSVRYKGSIQGTKTYKSKKEDVSVFVRSYFEKTGAVDSDSELVVDTLADDEAEERVTSGVEQENRMGMCHQLIDQLPDEDKDFVIKRFGLLGQPARTHGQLAEIYQSSVHKMQAKEKQVLARLREIANVPSPSY